LVLHYFQDLSYAEMAKALAVSEPAVRQRVSRALHHLQLALRSRGYSGNAVVLLLAAVAMDSSLAIPAGLPVAALALAESGAHSSLSLVLAGLLPNTAKTIALIVAVAGTALLWQTNPPPPSTAGAALITPPAQISAAELSRASSPVRFASTAPQMPRDPQMAAPFPVRQSGMTRNGARRAAPQNRAAPAERGAAPSPRPETSPPPVQRAAGDTPASTIAQEFAEAPETLEAILEGAPRLAWELREAELVPLKAAELYSGLLTQLLGLTQPQELRVAEFLVDHYTELADQRLAGRRPADFPTADWRAARQLEIEKAIAGIEAAVEGDAPVIRSVLTLAEEVEISPDIDAGGGTILGL
jgi:hypothetical protein